MGFRLTPRSMTLDDLELNTFEFSLNFAGFRRFRTQQQIGQYCQRQRCKHVETFGRLSRRAFVSNSWAFLSVPTNTV